MQVFMLILALGFPVALIFAWAFELTPEGLKRESEVDRSRSISNLTARSGLNIGVATLNNLDRRVYIADLIHCHRIAIGCLLPVNAVGNNRVYTNLPDS
jgi:hypothetical protein